MTETVIIVVVAVVSFALGRMSKRPKTTHHIHYDRLARPMDEAAIKRGFDERCQR